MENKDTRKKIITEIIAIIIGVAIALIEPPEGLTIESMRMIGISVWAILNWILRPIPDFIVAIMMCALWVLFKVVPFPTAFAAYSTTMWWILVGAMGLGIGVSKSGLLKRVSFLALKLFPPSFNGQVLALIGSGTLVAPMIPSATAKSAIMGPLSMGIADNLGLEKRSKGRTGLFCAMYTGYALSANIFLSASFLGYTVLGVLPEATQAEFTWTRWLVCMIPWGIVLLVGSYFFITMFYKPDTSAKVAPEFIKSKLDELGPMSRNEKITLAILVGCLVFWIGESAFGIPAVVPTLIGMGLMIAFGVFGPREFQNNLTWPLIMFVGAVMSLGTVMPAVGINEYLVTILGPFMSRFAGNPYIFIAATAIAVYLCRALIVSLAGCMTLFIVMLAPLAQATGMSPWIIGITCYVSINVWYLEYLNPSFLSIFAATGGEDMVAFKDTVKMSIAYMVLSLLGLLISVPYWRVLGLFS